MTSARFQVLIVGHGEMGRAMTCLLRPRHEVVVWQRHPPDGAAAVALEPVAWARDFIVFCVPANPLYELAARIRPVLTPDCLCLGIAKGLDDAGRTAAVTLGAALGAGGAFALMYGPMIAEEIRAAKPAFAQLATRDPNAFARTRALFAGAPLYLEPTTDVAGVCWCAVLKNVYAILFGIADELGLGDNTRGYLSVAALREMQAIVTQLDGDPATVYQLAGLGDLVTTGTSAGSHHHALGRRLARGESTDIGGEGIHTLERVRALRLFEGARYPLYALIDAVVRDPATAAQQVGAWLQALYAKGLAVAGDR